MGWLILLLQPLYLTRIIANVVIFAAHLVTSSAFLWSIVDGINGFHCRPISKISLSFDDKRLGFPYECLIVVAMLIVCTSCLCTIKQRNLLTLLLYSLQKNKMESESSDEESDVSPAADCDEVPLPRTRRPVVEPKPPVGPPPEVHPKRVVRPCPASPPPQSFPLENDQNHVMDRQLWLIVFSFLSQPELCTCMRVCHTWNRWCMDRRLWSVIDLSEKRVVTPAALKGIVRRQPTTLNLSWTNITFQQLQWLLNRLPRIRELYLSGTTEATVYALSSVICPRLKVLGLSWSVGITDSLLKELVLPVSDSRAGSGETKSPFFRLSTLFLSGCDVTGSTLRLLVQHCPDLRKLDLSFCPGITDQDIESVCGQALINEFLLSGCPKLSDKCLSFLQLFPSFSRLDLRSCNAVTTDAVQEFVKTRRDELKIVEGKLIVNK